MVSFVLFRHNFKSDVTFLSTVLSEHFTDDSILLLNAYVHILSKSIKI